MQNDIENLQIGQALLDEDTFSLGGFALTLSRLELAFGDTVTITCPLVFTPGAFVESQYTDLKVNAPIRLQGNLTVNAGLGFGGAKFHFEEITGSGNIFATAHQGSVTFNKDSFIEFAGTGNTFTGKMFLKSTGTGRFFFASAGYVATNSIVVQSGDSAWIILEGQNRIGDHAVIKLLQGAQLKITGDDTTVGSLDLENVSADAAASTLDTGSTVLLVNDRVTASVDNDHVHPVIKGRLMLNGSLPFNITGGPQPGLEILANLESGGFEMTGNGTLILEGSNSFSADRTVTQGTLQVSTSSALHGTGVVGGVVLNGGNMVLQGVTISGVPLTSSVNSQGNSFLTAVNQCAWNGRVVLDSTLNVSATEATSSGLSLDLTGIISGSGGLNLVSSILGGGTVRLSGVQGNTFTGPTIVNCQTLELAKSPNIRALSGPLIVGGGEGDALRTVRWRNPGQCNGVALTLFANGLVDLFGSNEDLGAVTFNGGRVETDAGQLTIHQPLTVNPSETTAFLNGFLGVPPPGNAIFNVQKGTADPALLVNAVVFGNASQVIKQGLGTMRLSGQNLYTAPTQVNEGVLEVDNDGSLGAANLTAVATNATLRLRGAATVPETQTLSGTGALGTDGTLQGALQTSTDARVTWTGPIQLLGPTTINLGADSGLNINAPIRGTGPLTTVGSGVVDFSGNQANTYSGDTVVRNSALGVNKAISTAAVPGNLIIGGAGPATVQNLSSFNILGSVTVDRGGIWDLNGQTEGLNHPPLILNNGGSVRTGSGILFLPGGGGIVINPGTVGSSTISGRIGLDPGAHTFTVIGRALGRGGPECTINGIISQTAPNANLTKDGTGWLLLSGTNTYAGQTVVSGGTLQLEGVVAPGLIQVTGGTLQGSALLGPVALNGSAAAVAPHLSTGTMICNNFDASALGSGVLQIQLNGIKPGSGYDQLGVRGVCNVAGIALNASLSFHSAAGDQFAIVRASADDPVEGTFNGLPEGATFTISGEPFNITYHGNGGTDVVLTHLSAFATTSTVWTNMLGGDWNNATNWVPHSVPNGSNATITNNGIYTITNNANVALAQFSFDNPFCTLTGLGSFNVNNLLIWQAGSFSSLGSVAAQGGMHIGSPTTSGLKVLSNAMLINSAQTTWTEAGAILMDNNAVLSNTPSGTFDCAGDGTMQNGPGTNQVLNAGLFRKTEGTGVTQINVPFFNTGTVDVQSGTLNLNNGGTNFGTITVPAGSTLSLGGSHVFAPGSSITGAGNLTINSSQGEITLAGQVLLAGTHTFSGGTVNLTGNYTDTDNDLTITGGTLNLNGTGIVAPSSLTLNGFGTLGGSNLVTVNGPLNWGTAATITGSNSIIANGPLTISGGGVSLLGRTLVNTTTALWSNNVVSSILLGNGAVLANAPNALFECVGGGIMNRGPGTNVFANFGQLRRSGPTNETRIETIFNNAGEVIVESGTLSLYDGGEETGAFTVSPGAALALMGGTHQFDAVSTIEGEGDFQVGGGIANLEGTLKSTGTHRFTFGTANITGNYNSVSNRLVIQGGTANFNGTGLIAPSELDIGLFGNLAGSNLVTVSGPVSLTSGAQLTGSNSVIAHGSMAISGGISLMGRTLVNMRTAVWTNDVPASFTLAEGAVLSNAPGAIFDLAFDGHFANSSGVNAILNAGLFRKIAGTGSAPVATPFINTGTVEIQSGSLDFSGGGYTQSDGATQLHGGNIGVGGSPLNLLGGVLEGNGVVSGSVISSGTLRPGTSLIAGALRTRSPLSPSISPGQIIITGNYTQATDGILEIAVGGTNLTDLSRLVVSNTVTLGGTLNVKFMNGFSPAANSTLAFLSSAHVQGNFAAINSSGADAALDLRVGGTNVALQVVNVAPKIQPIPDQTLARSSTLRLAVSATDEDEPAQVLSYFLAQAPPTASIDPQGVITWQPSATDPATNTFTVLVLDNGTPPLSASDTFQVTLQASVPVTSIFINHLPGAGSSSLTLSVAGAPGSRYVTEFTTDLSAPWLRLGTNVLGADGFWSITDNSATNTERFYRAVRVSGP
jgi:autotransporter-associated beta strand protein